MAQMAIEQKYGPLDILGIPDDEPVFILRAQDCTSLVVLDAYIAEGIRRGSPTDHLQDVVIARLGFAVWQAENETKVPD